MIPVTTVRNRPKAFSWSYSKLNNYETCPFRYLQCDINKKYREDDNNEHIVYGNAVHKALAERLAGKKLPAPYAEFEKWAVLIECGGGRILTEQQLAITEDLGPCEWFGKNAWYRGIADVIKIVKRAALVIDWKTGKIKEDGSQLALMAACVFAHHPEVQSIRTEFVWLKEDATTRADFKRDEMATVWANILPRVKQLKMAHDANDFPKKQGGLCRKWCPVTECPHHGV